MSKKNNSKNSESNANFNWEDFRELNEEEIEKVAEKILNAMSLKEKINQLQGDWSLLKFLIKSIKGYCFDPIPAGKNKRLKIPPIKFMDGPRGVVSSKCTCFPVSMARGATWDLDLEERIGNAIGIEARCRGANFFGGVCINLLRHPAWGRAQETYGEDSFHLGIFGTALVKGVQKHVMVCAKHYACNSIENARFKVNVKIDERTLREVYLPHFKKCVENGVDSIMSAYNKVNGVYCGQNRHLLHDILKNDWNFKGFVISDFIFGVRDGIASIKNGLDIEMPAKLKRKPKKIFKAYKNNEISDKEINDSVLRILRKKLLQNTRHPDEYYSASKILSKEHINLALEAARKSIVLLKNENMETTKTMLDKPESENIGEIGEYNENNKHNSNDTEKIKILPIKLDRIRKIAVLGSLCDYENIGDHGSSKVTPPYVVTPLQGIKKVIKEKNCDEEISIVSYSGSNIKKAKKIADKADICIVVAGYKYKDEGEYMFPLLGIGGDRKSLRLHDKDEKIIKAIAEVTPNIIVVMIGGSAIITENWKKKAKAILMAWYGGMEGGTAIADVLFGNFNPSGKLPCTFPKSEDQLPYFDRNAKEITYGYYHGYKLFEKKGFEPAFPFGYGLSFTKFEYSNLQIIPETIQINNDVIDAGSSLIADKTIKINCSIKNIGNFEGDEIAQLYIGAPSSNIDRPIKELKGFKKIHVPPAEVVEISFNVILKDLAYYDVKNKRWKLEKGEYRVYVGGSSRSEDLIESKFFIE
ncbi:MAG: beta-glucosidase family protein [Promethearchaeota archaeon]